MTNSLTNKQRKRYENAAFGLIILGFLVIAIIGIVFLINTPLDTTLPIDQNKLSSYGEIIGGIVGPIWALAGVVYFYQGMKEQRRTIELMQDQLELQREANLVSQQSQEVLRIQKFETTFFNLISSLNEVVKDLDIHERNKVYQGRDFFVYLAQKAKRIKSKDLRDFIDKYREEIHEVYKADIQHYVQLLYQLLKFVDRSDFDKGTKEEYIDIIRAPISIHEATLLFYEMATHLDSFKLTWLVHKHELLENKLKEEAIKEYIGLQKIIDDQIIDEMSSQGT
ncbi:MAG: putative phage abortive infection protein [Marinoscillum sp.]